MSTQLKQLRAFLAAAGYPDPAAVTQERTIWAAVQHLTPTSRICSASSMRQAATVINPEILKAVQTVYSTDLGLPEEWTPAQRMEFLTAEADKISSMAASMAETLWEQAITAWTRSRNGQTPNHATKVALLGDARAQVVTRVLNSELYELIETEETDETDMSPPQSGQPIPHRNQVDWQQRWTNPIYQSDPTPDLKALIDRLWPASDFSAPFRIKAGYLLAARTEDGLKPPIHREDPETAHLAQMIYSDLRTDGLPER
ncbi:MULTISPECIES: hypothetical protein [Mycobacterium ulcerans group]|uniref:Uncharacterized protein n=1 Tax=Mycobacterium marinum DL240490 TaxID=459420 RepID=B6CLQ3_MYCMR|nr:MULTISPECIES: hypothetical protein [Mycobacterium ulcerans group]ACA50977.1 conserved hypothetical protein [Mycobacterium marinum DL240490]MBC9862713.1 hypothetical protein [Mycobacterium pseudoshottsii]